MDSLEKFIEDLKKNMNCMTRSDIQGCVEAYCIRTGENEEKILQILDKYRQSVDKRITN